MVSSTRSLWIALTTAPLRVAPMAAGRPTNVWIARRLGPFGMWVKLSTAEARRYGVHMIRAARPEDVSTIAALIRELAEYEHLAHEVVLDETVLADHLFGARPYAEVLIAEDDDGQAVGFALFFHNFSTFLGRPGIYLEDLFVAPRRAATDSARRCSSSWRGWRGREIAAGSNGRCWTGMNRRSRSTSHWARHRRTNGCSTDSLANRWARSPTPDGVRVRSADFEDLVGEFSAVGRSRALADGLDAVETQLVPDSTETVDSRTKSGVLTLTPPARGTGNVTDPVVP